VISCDEVEELIGAYALGALPVEALAEIGEHLMTCEKHPEAAGLSAVAASLAFAAPEREPPLALKTRLMEAVREESAPAAPAAPERIGVVSRLKSFLARPVVPYALAGTLAIAVVALLITSGGGSEQARRTTISLSGENEAGAVVYELETGIIVFDAEGLEPLDRSQTYQLWSIADGQPSSLGLLGTAPNGETLTVLRADLVGVDTLAVTVEPAAGSPAPTTQPVLAGNL
jgi:anti-sigma-K factor RskA